MRLNAKIIQHRLNRLTNKTKFCVALSGGIDSVVLLHLMSQCVPNYSVRAIHIHHHLSPNANAWQAHCQMLCEAWKIPFHACDIRIQKQRGESLEALARTMRYAKLSDELVEEECLLTAHTVDDQAETILLQLMRGSGVAGLAAMPEKKHFSKSELLRPLLEFSRSDIECYAKENQLTWIEDESNNNLVFNRNYLRHQIIPLLKARWPKAAFSMARSSEHCATAKHLLFEVAATDLVSVLGEQQSIDLSKLFDLPVLRQQQVIRYWIQQHGFSLPSTQQLEEIFDNVIHSRFDAIPCVEWNSQQIRRYRQNLYLFKKMPPLPSLSPISWDFRDELVLPNEMGILQAKKTFGRGIALPLKPGLYSIRFRQGGETFIPAGCKEHHRLKKLFQEWGIPPWQRDRVPLLYRNDELIAIIGYEVSEGYCAESNGMEIVFIE